MNNKDKITIIVPAFNSEEYIDDCISSLLIQSYNNLEIIIVDDGSTDNTRKIIEEYSNRDGRILLYKQTNKGVSNARNKGLFHCSGEFVCFVDSDDTIDRDYCKTLISYMDEDIDVVVCGVNISFNDSFKEHIPSFGKVTGEVACLNTLESKNLQGFIWNKLFRTSIFRLNNIVFPEGLIYEDLLVCYKYCRSANYVQYIDKSLYNYRRREGSLCTNYNTPSRMGSLVEIIKLIDEITPRNEAYSKPYLFFLYNSLLRLNKCYIRSNYENSKNIFKECAEFIIKRIQTLEELIGNF